MIRAPAALLLVALSPVGALGQVPPPHGVNGAVLGTAAEHMTAGPARICFIMTGFDLRAGERAYLDYLGIHWAAIRIVGPGGEFLITEGNAWAEPRERGRAVVDPAGRRIVRYRDEGRIRYLIFGRVDGGPDSDRPLVFVEGEGLSGTETDLTILDRIVPLPQSGPHCSHRYVYGMYFE